MQLQNDINVFRFLDPRDYLREVYETVRANQERCSFERFSESLGFGRNSYSHQIISGRRAISEKARRKISDALGLTGQARKYFAALCRYQYEGEADAREMALGEILALRAEASNSTLDRAQVEYFSEWYHAVVRELVGLPGFDPSPRAIAARLAPGITEEEAAHSFRLLQRIGYVEYDAQAARWVLTNELVQTSPEVRSLSLMRFHRQMAERARDGIMDVPAAEREIGALTMALDEKQFQELKRQLQAFRRQIVAEQTAAAVKESEHGAQRVYQLNTHLIPLTKRA